MDSNDVTPIERISSLILKSLTAPLDAGEAEEIEKWRQESGQNEQLYRQLKKEDYLQERYRTFQRTHDPEGWKKLQLKLRKTRGRKFFLRPIIRYAAIFALLLGSGLVAHTLLKEHSTENLPSQMAEIQPGTTKAILELSNGAQIVLNQDSVRPAKVLKKMGITSHQKELIYQNPVPSRKQEPEMHTLRVPRGGEYKLILADGTQVWMNSGSVLHYPVRFEGKKRRVRMEGEAYFEVAKNPAFPFIVESGGVEVQVTGTEFNVKAYPEEQATVTTLVNGGVNLTTGTQHITLTPGLQASLNRNTDEMQVNRVNTALYTSWKDGLFEFVNMPLEEICSQLGRWYDVDFIFADPEIQHLAFTGAAKREKSIEFILNIISNTNAIRVEIKNKQIILNKK